jgi:hypothetical protein
MVVAGCSAPQVQHTQANDTRSPSQPPPTIEESQLNALLARVSQLQLASQESLEAAKQIGAPDHELTEVRQFFALAEQLHQDGRAAYRARQYEPSWDTLRRAEAAFRRAEESAVRIGLGHLERELTADYGRLLNPETRGGRRTTGAVRVSQGSLHLRDGAGTNFQIIGQAHLGDTLNILAESGEWYRVQTGTGMVGWVSKTSVTRIPMR